MFKNKHFYITLWDHDTGSWIFVIGETYKQAKDTHISIERILVKHQAQEWIDCTEKICDNPEYSDVLMETLSKAYDNEQLFWMDRASSV